MFSLVKQNLDLAVPKNHQILPKKNVDGCMKCRRYSNTSDNGRRAEAL
jgi:hypothetical protein